MIKALLKKQLLEVFSWLYVDKKSGKSRSKNGIILYVLLYVVLFCFLGGMFFTMALPLCEPLVSAGLGWLYFALMSLMAIAFGVFGSVFSTYSSMYLAKDNDLLLSMPIPPSIILFVRLCGVYLIGLMYELIVMVPTAIGWVLVLITVTLFIILTALFGLFMGLKMPNLNWTEETVPVKQSLSVTIALFSGWIAVIALGGLYFAISSFIAPEIYMCIVAVLLGVLCALLFRWINTKGAKLFAEL